MARIRHATHLVCQHLEGLDRKALLKYQDVIRGFVRNRHGIYALYRGDRLYYVGLASNLRTRLTAHLKDRHAGTWDRFSVYLTVGDGRLRELEALLMRIAKPRGNIQRGRFPKSQDLLKTFRSRVLEQTKSDMDGILGAVERRLIARVSSRAAAAVPDVGRQPVLAPFVTSPFEIRLRHKGKVHKARVRRDGTVRYRGRIYTSPSLAGKAARKINTNGWVTWEYERAPGDWVPLNELRRR